jgi:hypothetical protein
MRAAARGRNRRGVLGDGASAMRPRNEDGELVRPSELLDREEQREYEQAQRNTPRRRRDHGVRKDPYMWEPTEVDAEAGRTW